MKVVINLNKDGSPNTSMDSDTNYRAPAILRIFISQDNRHDPSANRPGPQDIAADILWRRQVDLKDVAKDPTFQVQIMEFMTRMGWDHPVELKGKLHFGFSRYAGCAMCPCSPGIVVQYENYGGDRRSKVVWVTLED